MPSLACKGILDAGSPRTPSFRSMPRSQNRTQLPHPELLTTLSHLAVMVGHGTIPVTKKTLQTAFDAALYAATKVRSEGIKQNRRTI